MATYIIFIRDAMRNETEFKTYTELAGQSLSGVALKPLVAYGEHETLEGPPVDGVVVLEFPDRAAAHDWYYGPAYQAAKDHRLKAADYRAVMVEGVAPKPVGEAG